MIIEGVYMQNVGRHASRDDDTDASTVGVLGPNGEGKSTWIDVIRICLTGGARDTLHTYMRDGGIHGKTVMGLRFRKNGKKGTIERTITKTSTTRKLEWEGKTYKAAAEVDAILAGILNADKRAVMNCVFVPQGDLNKILFGDETERRIQFTRMLGCGHFDSVARAAQQQAQRLRADTQDLEPTRIEISAQMEGHSLRFSALGDELDLLPDVSAEIANLNNWRNVKTAKQASSARLEQSRNNVVGMLRQVEPAAAFEQAAEIMRRENDVAKARHQTYLVLTQERDKLQKEGNDTQFLIDNLDRYLQAKTAHDELQLQPPLPPSFQSEIQNCLSALQASATRQNELNQIDQKQQLYRAKSLELLVVVSDLKARQEDGRKLENEVRVNKETHDKAVKDPRIGLLTMQIDLLTGVARHTSTDHKDIQECPVCKSTEGLNNMDPDALRNTMRAATTELTSLTSTVAQARIALEESQRKFQVNVMALTRLQEKQIAETKNLKDLEAEKIFDVDVAAETERLQKNVAQFNARTTELRAAEDLRSTEERRRASVMTVWNTMIQQPPEQLRLLEEAVVKHSTKASCEGHLQLVRIAVSKNREELESLTGAEAAFKAWWAYLVNEGAQYNSLLQADTALGPDPAPHLTLDAIQTDLSTLEVTAQKRRDIMASRNELQTAVNLCQDRMNELDRRQQAQHNKIMLANEMDTVAKVFGKEGVIAVFMADVFERLLTVIGPHLELLAAPFVVRRGSTPLSFEFKRTDEESTWQPDYKLSGGQRVKMSVAFLLALHQIVIPDVGLLVLDEPTVHLDVDSRENTRDLFENMGAILERTECQLIVCDHCPEILPALKKKVMIKRKPVQDTVLT